MKGIEPSHCSYEFEFLSFLLSTGYPIYMQPLGEDVLIAMSQPGQLQ